MNDKRTPGRCGGCEHLSEYGQAWGIYVCDIARRGIRRAGMSDYNPRRPAWCPLDVRKESDNE